MPPPQRCGAELAMRAGRLGQSQAQGRSRAGGHSTPCTAISSRSITRSGSGPEPSSTARSPRPQPTRRLLLEDLEGDFNSTEAGNYTSAADDEEGYVSGLSMEVGPSALRKTRGLGLAAPRQAEQRVSACCSEMLLSTVAKGRGQISAVELSPLRPRLPAMHAGCGRGRVCG